MHLLNHSCRIRKCAQHSRANHCVQAPCLDTVSLEGIALLYPSGYDLVCPLEPVLGDGLLEIGDEVWAVLNAKDMGYLLLVKEIQLVP